MSSRPVHTFQDLVSKTKMNNKTPKEQKNYLFPVLQLILPLGAATTGRIGVVRQNDKIWSTCEVSALVSPTHLKFYSSIIGIITN